jgi:aryl-alcohol dehydrogenase-like predicted oxidoreductase
VWSDEWVGRGDWLETIEQLKQAGKIRFFGVSINDHQSANVLELVRSGAVDSVQCIYNVFHQAPEDDLLPACAEHGVGVIVRVPLDEGALTGLITAETTFPEGDFRNWYFGGSRRARIEQRIDTLTADLGIQRDQMAEVALRYVLSHHAVSTVIPGMRTVRHVERNAAVGGGTGLDARQRAIVAAHRWEKNFYGPDPA